MRYLFVLIGLVLVGFALVGTTAQAAPRPGTMSPVDKVVNPGDKVDREVLENEARRFAGQLISIVDQVADGYYRPVSREELVYSALVGLYQGARQPVPVNLKVRIRQAASKPGTVISQTAVNAPIPPPALDPLHLLIQSIREEIGLADALRGQNTIVLCCQAMSRILDPYSTVVTAEEQQKTVGLDRDNTGFGVDIRDNGAGPVVLDIVQPGSPAQRAGLRPGDQITHLEDKAVRELTPPGLVVLRNQRTLDEALPLALEGQPLPPPPVKTLQIRYRRPGEEPRTVTLRREQFHPETVLGVSRRDDNSWDYFIDRKWGVAHIRLTNLGRGTSADMREVLERLTDGGLRGLVLDLRWSPGGYLTEAVEVADLFVGEGTIATVRSRGKEDMLYRSTDVDKFRDFPLVVLVNGETSGGAELVAAALQDFGRASVVGQRTLGKASVQTPLSLGTPGMALKLTSGAFIRPGGKNLHRFIDSKPEDDWGVRPQKDGDFRVSADLSKQLKQWWLLQSLRPARSMERLPLDTPNADPQQQQALALLRKLMDEKARAKAEPEASGGR